MWFVDYPLKNSLIWSGYISEMYCSIQGEIFFRTFELLLSCQQLLSLCNVLVLSTAKYLHTVLSSSRSYCMRRIIGIGLSRLFILHEHVAIFNISFLFLFCNFWTFLLGPANLTSLFCFLYLEFFSWSIAGHDINLTTVP